MQIMTQWEIVIQIIIFVLTKIKNDFVEKNATSVHKHEWEHAHMCVWGEREREDISNGSPTLNVWRNGLTILSKINKEREK